MNILFVESVEIVSGQSLKSNWKKPMTMISGSLEINSGSMTVPVKFIDYSENFRKWDVMWNKHAEIKIEVSKAIGYRWAHLLGHNEEADKVFHKEIMKELASD